MIAIHASPAIRYARLAERAEAEADPARTVRRLSPEEARRRDYAEIEGIEKGGPIAMADVMIVNEATVEALEAQVRAAALELLRRGPAGPAVARRPDEPIQDQAVERLAPSPLVVPSEVAGAAGAESAAPLVSAEPRVLPRVVLRHGAPGGVAEAADA